MIDCLIDSGNSRVKFAIHQQGQWQFLCAIDFVQPQFVEQCLQILQSHSFDKIYLANVSKGQRAQQLELFLEQVTLPIIRINTTLQLGRLKIAYPDSSQLGVDRFLAMLAASEEPISCIIISFGSALTIDVLTANGEHQGGLIAPSPEFQWRCMHDHFPGLFAEQGIVQNLARNTADALTSGIELQTLSMLERVIAENVTMDNSRILLTGGAAKQWLDKLPSQCEYVPEIIFHGMQRYIALSTDE
jgi:type III pantothenate kinase